MLIAILRSYQVLRLCCHFSEWKNEHSREIWYGKALSIVSDVNRANAGLWFVMRCHFKKSPFTSLICFIVTTALLSAYAIRIFERAYYATDPTLTVDSPGF